MHLTKNLQRSLPGKNVLNRLRFDRIMVVSPWPHFLAHRVGTDGLIVAKRYASQTAIGEGGHIVSPPPGR